MGIVTKKEGCGVRREFFYPARLSTTDAQRLDRLVAAAHDAARADFAIGLSACPTVRTLLPKFLRDPELFHGVSAWTVREYERVILLMVGACDRGAGDIAIDQVTLPDFDAWRDALLGDESEGVARRASTVNKMVNRVQRFARWCAAKGYCRPGVAVTAAGRIADPTLDRHCNRRTPRFWSETDFATLLTWLRRWRVELAWVLELMVYTGMRPGGIVALKRGDVTLPTTTAAGAIRFGRMKRSPAWTRSVMPGSRLARVLREICASGALFFERRHQRHSDARPLIPNRHGNAFTMARYDRALAVQVRKAGFAGFTAYHARHSVITWLKQRKVHPTVIQHFARHLKIGTQDIYDHSLDVLATEAHAMLDGVLPAPELEGEGGAVEFPQTLAEALDSVMHSNSP